MDADTQQLLRLHISGISPELAESINDLEKRIAVFGTLKGTIELRGKPTLDTKFGYLDVLITHKKFLDLKAAFKNVKFKRSILTIDLARKDYKQRLQEDQSEPVNARKEIRRKARENKHERLKLYKLEKSKPQNMYRGALQYNVLQGRERKVKRGRRFEHTFRVLVKGKLKTFRLRKTKLWGYDRNKTLEDLTWRYLGNGAWTTGSGYVIETVGRRIDEVLKRKAGAAADQQEAEAEENALADVEEESAHVTSKVLNDILDMFETKSNGDVLMMSDDEFGVGASDRNRNDNVGSVNRPSGSGNVILLDGGEAEPSRTRGVVYQSEDEDEDEPMPQFGRKEAENSRNVESRVEDHAEEDEDEPIPSFGINGSGRSDQNEPNGSAPSKPNDLSVLRSVFTADSTDFRLGLEGGSDIEEEGSEQLGGSEDQQELAKPLTKSAAVNPARLPTHSVTKDSKGLFFPHSDSPFLHSQSALSRLGGSFDAEEWFKEYEEMKEEVKSHVKRRRRDALRHLKKRRGGGGPKGSAVQAT